MREQRTPTGGVSRRCILRTLLAAAAASAVPITHAASDQRLRIGWAPWVDAEIVTRLAQLVLEQRVEQPVELVLEDIESVYRDLGDGSIDVMLMSWQPHTHAPLLEMVEGEAEDLGVIYKGVRLGWVVPDYVPVESLERIGDLAKDEVRRALRGAIQGIDPNSGLMRLSREALRAYGLSDYTLRSANAARLDIAIEAAVQRRDWIVATAWTPHWMFARYDLRFLEDPQGVLGEPESVHALGRAGFSEAFPEAAAFLRSFHLGLGELQKMMLAATASSPEQSVQAWTAANTDSIGQWVAAVAG